MLSLTLSGLAMGDTPAPTDVVQLLPALASPDAWQVREGDQRSLIVSDVDHPLAIAVTLAKDQEARLLLRQPLGIPSGSELSFVLASQEYGRPLWIFPIVRDANGREYLFHTRSNGSLSISTDNKGLFIGGRFLGGGLEPVCESRFSVPGLRHLDAPAPNFEPVKAGDPRPVAPLTMVGVQFKRKHDSWEPDVENSCLYLRDFAWSCLNSQNTALHYQFDDQECFGELDRSSQLPIGDLGKWYGRSFDICWDIRGQYEGQPFLAGERNLAVHCRSHPALQGYHYLLEHGGDAPYAGWYEGYDSYSMANFRADCRARYQSIAEVNRRWGTDFTDFATVQAPRRDKPERDQYWLDWMRFQSGAIDQFLLDCAKTIRREDPKRLIMVYCDGLVPQRLGEFRELGCMTANGGCADPQRGVPAYIRAAEEGVPQRAEEVSVFQWSASSPTQLDASMFSMLMGGGSNSNCKMYFDVAGCLQSPTGDLQMLLKPPYSLDRYERMMPVWSELRATVTQPCDIRYFEDYNSYLVQSKTTYQGWDSDPWATMNVFDSHLLFGCAPVPQWEKAKLLLLIRSHLDVLQQKTIEDLVKYVQDGGTLVMRADVGRRCVEEPGSDFALLKRFGFAPPVGARVDNQYTTAEAVTGGLLAPGGHFLLRETWNAGDKQPGQAIAFYNGDPKRTAVSQIASGRGRVVVVWASTIVPPGMGVGQGSGYPFLRDIAAGAGAALPVDADNPRFWLNLLTHRSGQTHYGLVYCNSQSPGVQTGKVRFHLPEGVYPVQELISGKDRGQISVAALRDQGLDISLAPDALAVYRFGPSPSAK